MQFAQMHAERFSYLISNSWRIAKTIRVLQFRVTLLVEKSFIIASDQIPSLSKFILTECTIITLSTSAHWSFYVRPQYKQCKFDSIEFMHSLTISQQLFSFLIIMLVLLTAWFLNSNFRWEFLLKSTDTNAWPIISPNKVISKRIRQLCFENIWNFVSYIIYELLSWSCKILRNVDYFFHSYGRML